MNKASVRVTRNLAFVLMAAALAACEAPRRAADFREQHPISVSLETVSLLLPGSALTGQLGRADARMFEGFIREFHLRAIGAVTIDAGAPAAEGTRLLRIERARALLRDAGVAAADINVAALNGEAGGRSVALSFSANVAKVPECGDWSSNAAYNWSNRSQANFGCSLQRNLGLMIADPRDLNSAQPMQPGDGATAVRIVRSYRTPAAAAPAAAAPAAGGAAQ